MIRISVRWFSMVTLALILLVPVSGLRGQGKSRHDQIPQVVMDGLKTRFPDAQIAKWTKETEDAIIIYDIEFTQKGKKFEADIKSDGSIHNWERAIEAGELPTAARKSVEKLYPGSSMREIMEIRVVKESKEELEGYEVVLRTSDKKTVEVTVGPDGKILEDSGKGK